LGLASYYRRFIQGFARIAAPLHRLTEKKAKFVWTSECGLAFEALQQALISAPILSYPQSGGQFVLDTDASNFAIGCVLSQVQDGEEKVVAYGSKSLSKSERNYCVTRRELLAIVVFLKKYKHYLGGSRVKVRTDHGSLRWIFNFKNPEGQLARWLEVLSSYDLDIEYRAGKKHQNADGLSRRPCHQCGKWKDLIAKEEETELQVEAEKGSVEHRLPTKCDASSQTDTELSTERVVCEEVSSAGEDNSNCGGDPTKSAPAVDDSDRGVEIPVTYSSKVCYVGNVPEITFEVIRREQLLDETIRPILELMEAGKERPLWEEISCKSATLKSYWSQWEMLTVTEGVLAKRWDSEDGKMVRWLIILPKGLRETVLDELHASKAAAHLGREKTLPKVRERYYWVGMNADVRAYLKRCVPCARRKGPPKKRRAPLRQYRVGAPMERIAIDVLGPLTETHEGNIYVLVVGDYFTKWMEAYPIKNQQAETVATKLVEEFVCRFGVPAELHSDQGRNFESNVFQEMCKVLGITKTRTTPYNPKSDGMVERYNRTIVNAVSLMILPHQNQKDWDQYLPFVGMAYRGSVQASTGESPNMMMLGRETAVPLDLVVGSVPHEKECKTEYSEELRERIREIHERAQHALKLSGRRQKRNYDRSVQGSPFTKGQFVWLHNTQRKPRLSKKLMLPWEGPYLIVTVLSDVTCRIQKTTRSKPKVVHVDRMKLYEGPELKGWEYKVAVEVEQGVRVTEEAAEPSGHGDGDLLHSEEQNKSTEERERIIGSDEVQSSNGGETVTEPTPGEAKEPETVEDRNTVQSAWKRVRFNPEVKVFNIPAYGKGMKLSRECEKLEYRGRGYKLDSGDQQEPVGRRNPGRMRRRPARYR
jgi:hypothetical protein